MATKMRKIPSLLISGILLISILIMVNPVSAGVYHVYESDGWQALHDTIQGASSGSTIYVHAGTYYIEDGIEFSVSNLTIIGDSPFNTIIDATSAGGNAISSTNSYTTMKNITIRNASGNGFYLSGNYVYIENCTSHSNGLNGFVTDDYGTLKNCLSYDNDDDGFQDYSHCTYINCTAAYNGGDGFYNNYGYTKVINCIAVGNHEDGFDIDTDWGHPGEITYSNAWGNEEDDYDETPAGPGSISSEPKFAVGRLGEYYLGYSSPCVDSGSNLSAALGLFNGFTTRTDEKWDEGKVDMGFHYASSRGPTGSIPIMKILDILKNNKN